MRRLTTTPLTRSRYPVPKPYQAMNAVRTRAAATMPRSCMACLTASRNSRSDAPKKTKRPIIRPMK